jgi:nucleoside-diphosphate-sugar epimerase
LAHPDESLSKPHALVTGSRGFTGVYVQKSLISAGYRVTGTRMPADLSPAVASQAEQVLDICSIDNCRKSIDLLRPSHIIHLAAHSFVGESDAIAFYQNNVLGTLNLLQACADVAHEPQCIILASSANVYGNASGIIDEQHACAPVNHYGASKLAMEHLAKPWTERLPIVITRPFNYTGRQQDPRFLLAKIVQHCRNRSAYIELGNLDVVRDFSDVRYVAEVYSHLLGNSAAHGKTVNICSGQGHALEQILHMVNDISKHAMEVRVNPAFVRRDEIKLLVGDPKELHLLVPNVEAISLATTIEWMMAA